LHRVADDTSGLTFQEWDPSAGTDDTSAPVAMLVNFFLFFSVAMLVNSRKKIAGTDDTSAPVAQK
jgi:hypothetical protein